MSKESFKDFVRRNTNLISYVNSGKMTWQKFYEMYDLYGENNQIWNSYKENNTVKNDMKKSGLLEDTSLKEIFDAIKKVDLDSVRKGVDGIQKAIALIQDLSINNKQQPYQKRPMYKYFED